MPKETFLNRNTVVFSRPNDGAGNGHVVGLIDDGSRPNGLDAEKKKLLTAAQEVELGWAVRHGLMSENQLHKLDIHDPDFSKKRQQLQVRIESGKAAEGRLFECNMGLVRAVANRNKGKGLGPLDLIQEGSIGLVKAIRKFDPERGTRFSTHAVWWIKKIIGEAISYRSDHMVRISVSAVRKLNQLLEPQIRLTQELSREPSFQELAIAAGIDLAVVSEMMSWQNQSSVDSSERPIGVNGFTLEDAVSDIREKSTETLVMEKVRREALLSALDCLTETERRVVELRFGMYGPEKTLAEIGDEFGQTRENIRQIEAKALMKLRGCEEARNLKDFLID